MVTTSAHKLCAITVHIAITIEQFIFRLHDIFMPEKMK